MGKSTELEENRARLRAAGTSSVLLDLGQDETWSDARDRLLSHPDVVAWQAAADGKLVILVDSVDEATTSMRTLTDQLLRLLDDLPHDRLLLRMASRSAAFPSRLREELRARFKASYRELDLAPLTWADAAQAAAAESKNGDASEFMAAVAEREIGVLASRPITLGMLLGLHGEGPLPTSGVDLYKQAVGRLVREMNPRRLDQSVGDIPIAQRLEATRTLAAITVLAGRGTIAVHRYPNMPEGQLCLDEVTESGDEPEVFAAVAGSALFAATSENTVRWTHRDFPEFLTGQRLAVMDAGDALALLSDPNDPSRVVPQLMGTAVWAALFSEQLFDWLLFREPELLLTATLTDTKPGLRRQLMQALLAQMENRPPGNWQSFYHRLGYDELAGDVAPYLDVSMPVWLRREAAWVLCQTGHHELDGQLVAIVESAASAGQPGDNDDNVRLGASVVACLRDAADREVLDRLTAVALDADAPRTIRVGIIGDLWRNRPASDVLDTLTAVGVDGGDRDFVDPVGQGLADAVLQHEVELGPLVDWLAANGLPLSAPKTDDASGDSDEDDGGGGARPGDGWVWVVEACVLAATGNPGDLSDEQWNQLSVLYSSLLLRVDDSFRWRRDDLDQVPDDGRRKAVAEVLQARPERYTVHFLSRATLLRRGDLGWVLRQYADAAAGSELAQAYGFAAQMVGEPTLENQELARSIVNGSEPLAHLVDELFSDRQIAERAQALAAQRQRQADDARTRKISFTRERLLAATEALNWADTAAELRRPYAGKQWPQGTPLTTSPGWQTLSQAAQAAVLDTAASYLAGLSAASPEAALANDMGDACTLLASANPGRLDAVDGAVLTAWLPALLDAPFQYRASALLIEKLGSSFPAHVDRAVIPAVEKDLARGHPIGIDRIGTYTSPAVKDVLDRLARDPAATGALVLGAVKALLERDEPRGAAAAWNVLRRRPSDKPESGTIVDRENEARRRWDQAGAAAAALAYSPALSTCLDNLLEEMSTSAEFASDVIAWAERRGPGRRPWEGLSAEPKADLLVWARRKLPKEPDYPPGQVVDVHAVYEFPRRVTTMLTGDVSESSVAALHRAADELDDPWLRREAEDLAVAVREANWTPLAPHEVREVLRDPRRRVITTEAQLAQVLLDGLDVVARDIQRDTNHRAAYWQRQHKPEGTFIPCDEPEFMTLLRWHLSTVIRGVSLRQEVELNHRLATVPGSEADIEAIARDGDRETSVVIEGKGIWHPKVRTAIRTQLHDRYLTGAHSYTGIYVVAAYRGEQWLETDSRRKTADGRDPTKLRAHLDAQAKRLSTPPRTIHVRVIDVPLDPNG
jgi:hypothetical protein